MARAMFRQLRIGAVALVAITTCHLGVLGAQSTPTAAMKAYYDAAKTKDFAALKGLLSGAWKVGLPETLK